MTVSLKCIFLETLWGAV